MTDKLEALKAAALAATPGPWFSMEDDWNDGEDSLITCELREGMTAIAKIDGGGSESGYDHPFKSEQQANAAFIAAFNPAIALELLAALEESKKEAVYFCNLNAKKNEHIAELEQRLQQPIKPPKFDGSEDVAECVFKFCSAIRAAGFNVEGD